MRLPKSRDEVRRIQSRGKRAAVERAMRSPFWKKRIPKVDLRKLDDPEVWRRGWLTSYEHPTIGKMDMFGMLVDLSHVTPETMEDAIRVAEAPVIFSHSSAKAVCDHVRNVPDSVLQLLPKNGGVVMVTFVAAFVSQEMATATAPLWAELKARAKEIKDPAAMQALYKEMSGRMPKIKLTIGQVADHIDHVRKVAGIDHVGIGGDYDGNDAWPEGLEDVSGYPRLFAELIRRGWSDADLAKLSQGNILRVMAQAETAARRLQQARPPSLATLESLDGPKPQGVTPPAP